jgi:hypothetical protein
VSVPLQVLNVVSPLQDSIIAFASSLIIATPFVLAMLALHYVVPEGKKFWTHAAVLMAVIYTTYNTLNYVVQLATVLPAGYTWTFEDQQGTVGPLSLLNQTPLSILDIDGLGYIFLNLATLLAVPALEKSGPQKVGPEVLPGQWPDNAGLRNSILLPDILCVAPDDRRRVVRNHGPRMPAVISPLLSPDVAGSSARLGDHASSTGRGQRPRGQLDPTRDVTTGDLPPSCNSGHDAYAVGQHIEALAPGRRRHPVSG